MIVVSQEDRVNNAALIVRMRLNGIALHEAEKLSVELMEKMKIVDRNLKRIEEIMQKVKPENIK